MLLANVLAKCGGRQESLLLDPDRTDAPGRKVGVKNIEHAREVKVDQKHNHRPDDLK